MPPSLVTVPTKAWFQSRTLWANALAFIILILGVVLDNAKLIDLPPQALGYFGMALAIANSALRFITTSPLSGGTNQTVEVPATNPPGPPGSG